MLGRSAQEQARVTLVKHRGHDQETVRGYRRADPLTAPLTADQLAERMHGYGGARGRTWGGGKLSASGKHCARGITAAAL